MGKALKKFGCFICFLLIVAIVGGFVYVFAINPDVLKPEYTVTLDIDSSQISSNSTIKVKDGCIIELPTPQERTGYVFDGWYYGTKKWTKEDKVKFNMKLTPKWTAKLYNIKFIVDGVEEIVACSYDQMAHYKDAIPTKQATDTTMFTFVGWEPELAIVKGEATYTAKFIEQARVFNVNVNLQYSNAGNASYDKKVDLNGNVTISIVENKGYEFAGWYNNNEPFTSNYLNKTITINNVNADINLTAKFNLINYTINYVSNGGVNSNITTYNAEMGTINLQDVSKTGYIFYGWYTLPNGKGTKIESININNVESCSSLYAYFDNKVKVYFNIDGQIIDSLTQTVVMGDNANNIYLDGDLYNKVGYYIDNWFLNEDCTGNAFNFNTTVITNNLTLYANWKIKQFTITFVVEGSEYTTLCNYNQIPVYPNGTPIKESSDGNSYVFDCWEPSLQLATTNTTYTAKFALGGYKVNFVVDGKSLDKNTITVKDNGYVSQPIINYADYGMSCYTVNQWYTDSNCTKTFNFSTPITKATTLYAKWEYILDTGFYDYLPTFNSALKTKQINISCEADLISWIEYVQFYQVTTSVKINFTNGYTVKGTNFDDLKSKVSDIIQKSDFPNGIQTYYSYNGNFTLTQIVLKSKVENMVTKKADPYNEQIVTQYEGLINVNPTRSADYDNFNINNVKQTIEVESSNQLVYALQKGLKPVPISNSSAETIYNKAKSVLRQICNDNMTDFEKIKAIYEWLILNVQYDHKAANDTSVVSDWTNYTAWYPEGVFIDHKAVCDGIAKSLLILARIENIACTRISGDIISSGVGHAWNKVYINNNWYGIDATHGDIGVTNNNGEYQYEILSYSSFLFTDAFKQKTAEFEIDEKTKTPLQALNVYQLITFGTGDNAFDLYINSVQELNKLYAYIQSYSKNTQYYQGNTNHSKFTIEIALDSLSNITIYQVCSKFGVNSCVPLTADGNIKAYAFVISF